MNQNFPSISAQINLLPITSRNIVRDFANIFRRYEKLALFKDGYAYEKNAGYTYYYGMNTLTCNYFLGACQPTRTSSMDLLIERCIPNITIKLGDFYSRGNLGPKDIVDPVSYCHHMPRSLRNVEWTIEIGAEQNRVGYEDRWKMVAIFPKFTGATPMNKSRGGIKG